MNLQEKIDQDLKEALKNREEVRLGTLRMLKSSLKNKQIELKQDELPEKEIISVIQKELKKRKDAADSYKQAGRDELLAKEEAEMDVLNAYLPEMMSEDEIKKIIDEIVAQGQDNFGLVMKETMTKVQGQADGQIVQRLVKEKLES
ncbi:glutamyl-tRNA amidotransferase [Candidatus Parcubacteria bacterium]|nr:MAG: glutamyl-tRNA amidotransferase [Candidatus Parcubacteria bacterium]